MNAVEFQRALEILGISPPEAARKLGVPASSVHRWITGKRPIRGPVAAAVRCWLTQKEENGK